MGEHRSDATIDTLAAEAERVRAALGVASASISVWERDQGLLRTLVNTGMLSPAERERPAPIGVRGEVWGSLWVATLPGDRPLSQADLPRIVRAAHEIARVLTGLRTAG
jgi:hypothetical protein